MTNGQIADVLEQLADLLEFQGANAFRIRAYRGGARAIRDLPTSVATLLEAGVAELIKLDGIGKGVAEKCAELIETGSLTQLEELKAEIPGTVLDMLRVPGMGPKKAAVIYNELSVSSLDELQLACEQGRVRELKGFGPKSEEAILKGISIAEAANRRIYWSKADEIAEAMREHMATCDAIDQLELAGSYRRGKETVGDLDVLVDSTDATKVMDHFGGFPGVADVIVRGDTKMSVRLDNSFQIDLRVVPTQSFGAALQYFTGSQQHNITLRGRAKQRGLKVNEWGVFREGEDEETYIAGETEADVYAALDLPVIAPELRESRREFEWAEQEDLPELISEEDIVGDLHMHTTETDGKASLEEMVEASQARGLKYIAITDHSQRVSMAGGLDPERLLAQWAEIDQLNETLDDEFVVLKGIECDILEKGGMDLPDEVLAQADWVLASVHYGQQQSREQITDRILGALSNPHVDAIAHPTGRLLNRREPYEVDMEAVFQATEDNGKLLELNANPMRLDLNDVFCAKAKARGIPIVINTDAHSTQGLGVMRYGIKQARRGGLTKADVANCRPWAEMKKLLP